MTRIGADPGQLVEAAAGFESLADVLDGAQREINGLLEADWWGPDADRFRGAWASTFRPEILRQSGAIRTYAAATRRQAEQQQASSDDRAAGATGGGASSGGYHLQDFESSVKFEGKGSMEGKGEWSNQAPGAAASPAVVAARPPGPGQPGFDEATYATWVAKQVGGAALDRALSHSDGWSSTFGTNWAWDSAGSAGSSDLGASWHVGAGAGAGGDASASYAYHGLHGEAAASANLHAGARVYGDFEAHAWKLANLGAHLEGSVEAGGTGHVGFVGDPAKGVEFEAGGSAFGGAHAGGSLDVGAVGMGAHLGAEVNAGWGVYGNAKAGWNNEKGITIGFSGGFGLRYGFGLSGELSFHPGKTWDVAVAGVQAAGTGFVTNAVATVERVGTAVTAVGTAVGNVANWAGHQAEQVGAAVSGTLAAMDPRHWSWPF